jgi:hypothetical protein
MSVVYMVLRSSVAPDDNGINENVSRNGSHISIIQLVKYIGQSRKKIT